MPALQFIVRFRQVLHKEHLEQSLVCSKHSVNVSYYRCVQITQ